MIVNRDAHSGASLKTLFRQELFGMIQAIGRPCLVGQGQTVAIGFRQWNAFGLCFLGKGWDAEPKKKEQIQDSHGARYEGGV